MSTAVRVNTYKAFEPLIVTALIYFTVTYILKKLVGINLSQDMLSEFVLPCYEKISESFGCPLLIHFCSVNRPIGKQIAYALKDSDAIAGISTQLGFELYEELAPELRGKLAIECGYGNGIPYAVEKYGGFRQFAGHIKSKRDSGMILYTTVGSVEEAQRLWEIWSET